MERSGMRVFSARLINIPDCASLHPGYEVLARRRIR